MRITKNLEDLKLRISATCSAAGRSENDVAILAVTKQQGIDSIRAAIDIGLTSLGENYAQEALEKMPACDPTIEWHFIGRLQSNKIKAIAEHFSWVQTVASTSAAEKLNRHRSPQLGPLNILVQVDTDGSGQHGGVSEDEAGALCAQIIQLDRLRLRGLMTVPLPTGVVDRQRIPFRKLRKLYEELREQGFVLDTLSMGMTDDLEAAVLEGSTMIRIGTALFGPRLPHR